MSMTLRAGVIALASALLLSTTGLHAQQAGQHARPGAGPRPPDRRQPAAPTRPGTSRARTTSCRASTSTWATSSPRRLFDDPNKVEYVNQSSDARIPNITTGKVDITCQFMTVTGARAQQVAFTIPYYREGVGLMMKAGGPYADFAAAEGGGRQGHHRGAAERLCRGHGARGPARGEGRPVRRPGPHLSGAEFRPGRRGRHRPVLHRLVHDAEPRAAMSMPAMAGTRRPMPARSSAATRTG